MGYTAGQVLLWGLQQAGKKGKGFWPGLARQKRTGKGGGHCPSVSEELGSGKPLGCRQRALHPSQNQSRASPRLSIQTGCEQALLCQIPAARMEESCGEEVGPGGGVRLWEEGLWRVS